MEMEYKKMEEIRKIQLEILNEIKRITKKYQISYFLDGGTLMGALTYGGFGPYDDDIDVGMIRKDYESFFEICKKELNPSFYIDEARLNSDYHLVFIKVKKKGTEYLEENGLNSEVFVDIFPYDFIGDNLLEFKIKKFIAREIKTIIFIKKLPILRKKRWVLIKILFFRRSSYYQREYRKWVEYKNKNNYLFNFAGEKKNKKELIPLEDVLPTKEIFFEGCPQSIPNDEFGFLRKVYGKNFLDNYLRKNGFKHYKNLK